MIFSSGTSAVTVNTRSVVERSMFHCSRGTISFNLSAIRATQPSHFAFVLNFWFHIYCFGLQPNVAFTPHIILNRFKSVFIVQVLQLDFFSPGVQTLQPDLFSPRGLDFATRSVFPSKVHTLHIHDRDKPQLSISNATANCSSPQRPN